MGKARHFDRSTRRRSVRSGEIYNNKTDVSTSLDMTLHASRFTLNA